MDQKEEEHEGEGKRWEERGGEEWQCHHWLMLEEMRRRSESVAGEAGVVHLQ